ncbi:unnamed protein product, partial [marine sediment metagenome]
MRNNEELHELRNKYVPQAVFNVIPTFIQSAQGAIM